MLVPKFRAGVRARVTLRVLAVDDERPALDDLARVLRAQPAVAEVETAESGEEALHALAGEHYDAVFLDVRMPGLDGVELARVLRRFAAPPALIFVSAYESAAVEAFELRALDYLIKPVSRARVAEALARVSRATGGRRTDTLAVDAPGGGTRLIRREDVLYLQAHGDYVRVSPPTAASSCAARSARSSAAGSRTASTASTAASSSTCAGPPRSARSSTAPRC